MLSAAMTVNDFSLCHQIVPYPKYQLLKEFIVWERTLLFRKGLYCLGKDFIVSVQY